MEFLVSISVGNSYYSFVDWYQLYLSLTCFWNHCITSISCSECEGRRHIVRRSRKSLQRNFKFHLHQQASTSISVLRKKRQSSGEWKKEWLRPQANKVIISDINNFLYNATASRSNKHLLLDLGLIKSSHWLVQYIMVNEDQFLGYLLEDVRTKKSYFDIFFQVLAAVREWVTYFKNA